MRRFIKIAATFFYVGECPIAPGTAASLAGLLLYLAVNHIAGLAAVIFCVLLAAGFFSSGRAEKIYCEHDPPQVVIDEVCGMFLVFLNVPLSAMSLAVGFIFYRILDIAKPFPIRRLEKLPGSMGIMVDDLFCGLCANFILQVLFKFNILKV